MKRLRTVRKRRTKELRDYKGSFLLILAFVSYVIYHETTSLKSWQATSTGGMAAIAIEKDSLAPATSSINLTTESLPNYSTAPAPMATTSPVTVTSVQVPILDSTQSANLFLQYCNGFEDLKSRYCPGVDSCEMTHLKNCQEHWQRLGRNEPFRLVNSTAAQQLNQYWTQVAERFPLPLHETIHEAPNSPNNNNSNKTLVILMGNLRCGEPCWHSLYKRVLDYNSADLALMIGETIPDYKDATVFERSQYIWEFEETDEWETVIDVVEQRERELMRLLNAPGLMPADSWRQSVLPKVATTSINFAGVKGFPRGAGAVQFMSRYFVQDRIRALGLAHKYDQFVVIRSDAFYSCPMDLRALPNNRLSVPLNDDWGGINDRAIVAGSEIVLKALDVYPSVIRDPKQYDRYLNLNPESFLLQSFRLAGLRTSLNRFKRTFYTCMRPGDQTSWGDIWAMGVDGVFIKKINEYAPAVQTCKQQTANPPPTKSEMEMEMLEYCPFRLENIAYLQAQWDELTSMIAVNATYAEEDRVKRTNEMTRDAFVSFANQCLPSKETWANASYYSKMYVELVQYVSEALSKLHEGPSLFRHEQAYDSLKAWLA